MELEMTDEILTWVFRGSANRILERIYTGILPYALNDGVCFGPHALTPGFMESRNRRAFVAQIPMIRIIVTLFSVPIESLLIKSKKI